MAKDTVAFKDILKSVEKGRVESKYLFYGPEIFLADRLVDAIVRQVFGAPKDDFNLHVFYGKEATPDQVIHAANAFPMMAERQVVILKDAEQLKISKDTKDILTDLLHKIPESTVLIVMGASLDTRANPWFTFRKMATVCEFKPLRESEVAGWVESYLKESGKTMTPQAAMLMNTRVDLSLRDIYSQLEKLATFVGTRTEIDAADVESVVGISRQYNIFELCNAVGRKDLTATVRIFRQMMLFGGEPVYMIVMLNRHFNLLMTMCEMKESGQPAGQIQSVMMNEHRIFPNFFYDDYWPQAQKFSVPELRRGFRHLLEADLQLKSSAVEKAMIMQQLFYRLTSGVAA